tara:strand:- start:2536 stop:3186 length:651 start_codon:yes stop_codon:yes gene_type:complete
MTIKLNGSTAGSVALDAPAQTTSSADITFKLPVADGTAGQVLQTDGSGNLSWVSLPTSGLAMADQWRLTSNVSVPVNSNTYLTSNWERNDSTGFGLLGSGMSESSGEFTFPSTGIYLIQFHTEVYFSTNTNPRLMSRIYVTTDNSNYSYVSLGTIHAKDGGYYASGDTSAQFDVTNTSTHKVKFLYYHTGASGGATITGDSSGNETHVTFLKLGET